MQQNHRYHMWWQCFTKLRLQCAGIQRQARLRHQIAHQLTRITTSGCRLVNHTGVGNGLFDIRQRLHHAIDFAQFDTLPANF
ncbi:Uncharacterised protein [Shigella sonnei]|nr:Uncharacterised protein [Shigella sonnei]